MNKLSYLINPKIFAGLVGLFVLGALGLGMLKNEAVALPVDCDTTSIINCGFQDHAGFQADYNANAYGDVDNVYNYFGLQGNEMGRFMSTAKWAWVYKTGQVILDDGRVVATNGWSIGRNYGNGSNPYHLTIDGKGYRWGYNGTAFAASRIRALVMMDTNDKYMEFAVLTSCGNPVEGTKPVFQCDMLNKTKLSETKYEFWSEVTAKDGASVSSLVYDMGDGNKVTKTNPAEKFTHTYTKAGNYTVTLTVTYNVNGVAQGETVQEKCKTVVVVEEEKKPVYECKSLDGQLIEGTKRKYEFVVVGHVKDGAKLVSASFDFGDGNEADNLTEIVKIDDNHYKVTTSHTYADNLTGEKTITADLKFSIGTDNQNKRCQTKINLEELPKPAYECKMLTKTLIGSREYRFKATAHVANGAKLVSADFNFGDGFKKENVTDVVKVDNNTFTISAKHKYAANLTGEKTITADLTFTIGEDKKDSKCQTSIKFKTCEERGDCKVLPSTGPAEMLISGLGLSTLVGAGLYYRNSRRSLIADLLNK